MPPLDTFINKIHTGDMRLLSQSLPDESIDLIFCDPVYQNIEDYAFLGELAQRVLQPDSACLAFCSNIRQYEVVAAMRPYLDFILPFQYVVIGKTFRLHYYHTFIWTTPCLWFSKGHSVPNRWLPDTYISATPTARDNTHKWNKNPEVYLNWISAFCESGGTVLDPFAGGCTTALACRQLGLNYILFEIDPDIAAAGRERVRNYQPLLLAPREAYSQPNLDL